MRIAFIITGLSTGGAEMMLQKLLQNIDRKRFEPLVISMTSKGEIGPSIEALGIPVLALGMRRGIPNPMALLRLWRLLRGFKPDLVNTWMYHADLLGGLTARFAGCKQVIWGLHHSNLSRADNKFSTLIVVWLCSFLSKYLPVGILSCSHRAKVIHVHAGYAKEKIHVIPNGFDLTKFAPELTARTSVRSELGLPPDTQLVGVVARYDPQKNHLGFLQAAAQVLSEMPRVHFVLAGTAVDSENHELQAAIAALPGLQPHMHLLGRRDDVPRLMAAFDVLASPSNGEAFPNVLGEAMACGLPCVVTDAGDSAEIVGPTGRVVPVGDMPAFAMQLLEVLCLPAIERETLGLQARARVQAQYEIVHVAGQYQAFYERLVNAP